MGNLIVQRQCGQSLIYCARQRRRHWDWQPWCSRHGLATLRGGTATLGRGCRGGVLRCFLRSGTLARSAGGTWAGDTRSRTRPGSRSTRSPCLLPAWGLARRAWLRLGLGSRCFPSVTSGAGHAGTLAREPRELHMDLGGLATTATGPDEYCQRQHPSCAQTCDHQNIGAHSAKLPPNELCSSVLLLQGRHNQSLVPNDYPRPPKYRDAYL
mmetsp:Transcript_13286/g.33181  ORF Transcript_13286/g.33181 Transcript_13286/m.33181 type:complete len:211 (-) Transcript_13286:1056-1688(-)